MSPIVAYISPQLPLRHRNCRKLELATCPLRKCRPVSPPAPAMIQRPDADGPPSLDAFFDSKSRSLGTQGAPISLATARTLTSNFPSPADAALAALQTASQNLDAPPQLCHVTISLDVDPAPVADALYASIPSMFVIGRSVNKKDSVGTIEVLLLQSDSPGGIAVSSSSEAVEEAAGDAGVAMAARRAASKAAADAVSKLSGADACTIMVFSSSPGAGVQEVREAVGEAGEGIVAYGGPAVGASDTGMGWGLIGGEERLVQDEDVRAVQTVHVAAVPGSLSFLFSAVIKTWVQPAYVEPLSFMSPTYVGDAQIDLLTAIRYDDWEKFIWCIEEEGVDVNTKWVNKQNQSPLLAACGRARIGMVKYLIEHGADVHHRNDGGFTASMYTRMLTGYDDELVRSLLQTLEDGGLDTKLSEEETERLKKATGGRIVE